jgi:hypothetical protein
MKAAEVGQSGRWRRQDSLHGDWSLEQKNSETGSIIILSVGNLLLTEEALRYYIAELLKLRLRQLVRVLKDIVLIRRKCKRTLSCSALDD